MNISNRLRYLPLLFIILVNVTALPQQIVDLKRDWPVVRLWHDPAAQMDLMLGDVSYRSLKSAAEHLASDVTLLLVTSGEDVRRQEYATYHRALYLLTPRPVWWLSPAPSDGTWESRWWISRPLTAENIAAVAAEKSADCLLLVDVPAQPDYGTPDSQLPGAQIIQLGSKNCLADNPASIVDYPAPFWPLRLLLALLVILAFGFGFLALTARLGAQISRLEALALAWLLGAGLLSTAMLGLNGLGFSLDNQLVILTIGAALLMLWQRRYITGLLTAKKNWSLAKVTSPAGNVERFGKSLYALRLLLIAFLLFQLIFIILMAMGRPLTIWDSWVNWGSKGRTIFLENGITPALYADASREVMLLGYPLSIPLLEAWLYGWLGAADDRLVGVLFVLTYLALGGFVYGFCRRRGLTASSALLVVAAAVSLAHIVGLAATAFTDLWLPVLLALSAVYLLEWLENGQRGYLLIAAVAAGLLTWVKQEGTILALVLLISFVLTFFIGRKKKEGWNGRRLVVGCGSIGLAAVIFGGPWWLFAGREAALVSAFMPLTGDNLLANIDRLPVILQLVAQELLNPRTGFLWLLVPLAFLLKLTRSGRIVKRPSILFLLVPVLYLGTMSIPYLFSNFVPYQQHILSSFFRINAHILLLLLLWLGFQIEGYDGS
jgi:hypothetical protein